MLKEYFETLFQVEDLQTEWPEEFVILSAYATTGEKWPEQKNLAADQQLESHLRKLSPWMKRVIGASPTTTHAEPSWAVVLDFAKACDIGLKFHQEAIYHVKGDSLSVSYCDERRRLIPVGSFLERLK